MAINYKDTRQEQTIPNGLRHLMVGVIAACCLIWFAPQTTARIENAVASALRLPF